MMPDLQDSRASPHGESIPSASVGVLRRDPGCGLRSAQFPLSHVPKETCYTLLGVAYSADITMARRQYCAHQFSSVAVVSNSLRPHESEHTRSPCPSPTPGVYPNSCSSSR